MHVCLPFHLSDSFLMCRFVYLFSATCSHRSHPAARSDDSQPTVFIFFFCFTYVFNDHQFLIISVSGSIAGYM